MYKQSFSLLYNPEKITIPIVNCDYSLNVNCVDMLCQDAVGFPHYHCFDFEIYYMLYGTLNIVVNNEKLSLNENEYMVVAPGVNQYTVYEPTAKNEYFVMVFSFQKNPAVHDKPSKYAMSKNLIAILDDIKEKKYLTGKDRQDAAHYINHMTCEVSKNGLGWKSMLYHYYTLFVICILRNVYMSIDKDSYEPHGNMAMYIIKYLSENYNRDISLQDVADAFFCSSRQIDRIFRQYFNAGFGNTLSRFRVNYAKNYLVESDYPIEKISELVGFSSPNALYKLFKEIEGTSPGKYREVYGHNWKRITIPTECDQQNSCVANQNQEEQPQVTSR